MPPAFKDRKILDLSGKGRIKVDNTLCSVCERHKRYDFMLVWQRICEKLKIHS